MLAQKSDLDSYGIPNGQEIVEMRGGVETLFELEGWGGVWC